MAREAVACPSCGTRNRPSWEFCARCNEPLLPLRRRPFEKVGLKPLSELLAVFYTISIPKVFRIRAT